MFLFDIKRAAGLDLALASSAVNPERSGGPSGGDKRSSAPWAESDPPKFQERGFSLF